MKRQYLLTERAHFMCPNMHFGMLMELETDYIKEKVKETLDRMSEAHPFLKSLIAYEEGTDRLYYKITEDSQISLNVKTDIATFWEDYSRISDSDWNVFQNGMLKVYVYPQKQGMAVLLIAHHLLVDGRGLLELAQEFANSYVEGLIPDYVEEQLIESIRDLPIKSELAGISKLLIKQANRQWRKENHKVSYEQYQSFVKIYSKNHNVEYMTYELKKEEVEQMKALCKENGVTINDLLMASMYQKTGTNKIIIAADIRNDLDCYKAGALGNYSTAMGIVCKSKTADIVQKAREVHELVQKHKKRNRDWFLVMACYLEIEPTLLDAAAISALGGFESKAGSFVGGGMFGMKSPNSYSITNLGRIENKNMKSLMFIPPASPAAKLTLGVVTLNGIMKVCSSENKK